MYDPSWMLLQRLQGSEPRVDLHLAYGAPLALQTPCCSAAYSVTTGAKPGRHLVCAALLAQSGSPTAGAAAALRSWPRARSRSGVLCRCARAPLSSSGRATSSSTASWRSEICAMLCRPSGRHNQLRSRRRPPADNKCCIMACWGPRAAHVQLSEFYRLMCSAVERAISSPQGSTKQLDG